MKKALLSISALFLSFILTAQTYTFTTGGATGNLGPSQTQLNAAYAGTPLAGAVTSNSGIQIWTVPWSGNYKLTAIGAQGFGPFGGRGAQIEGEFALSAGQQLKILVGQQGACCAGAGTNQYGGGGGSFVTDNNNSPFVVAGGGGGSWAITHTTTTDASLTTSGNTAANGSPNGAGGINGQGGASASSGDGGGGLLGNGLGTAGGFAFVNGGNGGTATNGGTGGFGGGGGGSSWNNRRGGGGGGYSGGGGSHGSTSLNCEGGGGGSFNSGINPLNIAGVGLGDGTVIIESLSPPAPWNPGVAGIIGAGLNDYYLYPFSQTIANFQATVRNFGFDTISGTLVNFEVLNTPYFAAQFIDTLYPDEDTLINFFSPFIPTMSDTFTARAIVSCNELDTTNSNDTAYFDFFVSDTVIARDNGIAANGIGNGTPVGFGHRFSLNATDTITSISYFLETPTQGTKIRGILYAFNPVTDEPDIKIDSTIIFQVPANGQGWYTQRMGCGEVILPAGEYFIAAEQINPVNMGFGYSSYYPSNLGYILNYVDLKDGQGWLPSTSPSLNQLLNSITFMLRVNLGHGDNPNVLRNDTTFFCNGSVTKLGKGTNFETYQWSTGSFQDSLVVNSDGFYSVTVTDVANCTFTGSTYAKELNPISTFPTTTPATSCGGSDGTAQMIAIGDKPPFVYNWSNGASGLFTTGLSGGTHTVTITDAIGCEYVETVSVLGAFPTTNVSTQSPTCNGFFNGSANVSIVSAVNPVNYSWSNGSTASTLTGVSAGSYTVSITDASGCTSVETVSISNPALITADFSASTNPTMCRANDGIAVAKISGGVAPYSYLWSNGQNTNSIISLKAGSYDVTITDDLGCQKVETVVLSDPNSPSLSTQGSSVTCGDDSTGTVSVNITGGTPTYSILWSNNSTGTSASNLPSGTYQVQVVDGAGCISFANATVTGPDPIVAILQANYDLNNICNNDIFITSLTGGTPPFTYLWDDPNAQTSASATGLCNRAYNVDITDANSCTKKFSIIIYNPKTGLNEVANIDWLNLYPNPTSGLLNIEISKVLKNASIKVLNIEGKVIENFHNIKSSIFQIDLSNQAPGSYFISIQAENENVIQQIQIVR